MMNVQSYLRIYLHGDNGWELYSKKMKVLWHKIKIELDDTLSLPFEDVKAIHGIAKEQGDNYYNDCYHFGSLIDTLQQGRDKDDKD